MDTLHQPRHFRLNRSFLLSTIRISTFVLFSSPPRTTPMRTQRYAAPSVRSVPFFPGLDPVHTLVPSFAKAVDCCLCRSENMSAQVVRSQGIRIDKHLKLFRDVVADFSMFDGSRPITFLKVFRISGSVLTKPACQKQGCCHV